MIDDQTLVLVCSIELFIRNKNKIFKIKKDIFAVILEIECLLFLK